jgi:hypothetical protein
VVQINPNVLQGHEGALLQLKTHINCWEPKKNTNKDFTLDGSDVGVAPIIIPKKEIVMYLKTIEHKYGYGTVDLLWGEKVLRHYIQLNNWLRIFVPWPHGGFVPQSAD